MPRCGPSAKARSTNAEPRGARSRRRGLAALSPSATVRRSPKTLHDTRGTNHAAHRSGHAASSRQNLFPCYVVRCRPMNRRIPLTQTASVARLSWSNRCAGYSASKKSLMRPSCGADSRRHRVRIQGGKGGRLPAVCLNSSGSGTEGLGSLFHFCPLQWAPYFST
jgi:hypothetical protein